MVSNTKHDSGRRPSNQGELDIHLTQVTPTYGGARLTPE
jgi:hypothetical protein